MNNQKNYSNQPSRRTPAAPGNPGPLVHTLVICAQFAILLLLYTQSFSFDYVYFDDAEYVLENHAVRSGLTLDSMHWAFTSFYMSNWHPLSWLSHMLDVTLFGLDPGWAHVHNTLLHGINSLLVYALLLRICGDWWKACLLSLIFLVHPLHVESVAWIAERKDLLSAFFFLVGLLLYDSYRSRPNRLRYIAVLATFGLALMAKPMAVTFPVVLLILDFFVYRSCFQSKAAADPGGRVDYFRAAVEKLPLLALAAMSSVVTIAAQDAGKSLAYIEAHSLASRWSTVTNGYITYLKQWLAPVDLAAFYPVNGSASLADAVFPSVILLALVAVCVIYAKKLPLMGAGIGWYLVTLLPVIGLIQVGSQAHADRYMYLPSVGLLIACTYLLPSREKKQFQLTSLLTVLFVAYLGLLAYWQIGYWKNQHVLFTRVLNVVGPNYQAHIHLAHDYILRGMLEEARQQSLAAVNMDPNRPDAHQAMGNIALAEKNFEQAEQFYRMALSRGPRSATVVNNIGISMAEQGQIALGIQAFESALEIDPQHIEAQQNLQHYRTKTQGEITR